MDKSNQHGSKYLFGIFTSSVTNIGFFYDDPGLDNPDSDPNSIGYQAYAKIEFIGLKRVSSGTMCAKIWTFRDKFYTSGLNTNISHDVYLTIYPTKTYFPIAISQVSWSPDTNDLIFEANGLTDMSGNTMMRDNRAVLHFETNIFGDAMMTNYFFFPTNTLPLICHDPSTSISAYASGPFHIRTKQSERGMDILPTAAIRWHFQYCTN